ncbi:alpha/beta fold hydrolase [Allocoprobacillus halotolerans]|uniref:Alpha/beta fold hydrolase n=1 Tax=Allocoprobacillus halotolerans TaxID=2944914 RepID=A0ABY5HYB7_9FIRM|nr:alpha/beta fold hydrolase [Allocoprobacillus halotolerans]UTY38031.1 alpha/beta fold hydrolase [Allocoprobacillus halotolerans]
MKKSIKIILCFISVVVLFLGGITFYVGNYLYDYTLNPLSQHSLFENMVSSNPSESHQWLETHAVHTSIQSYDDLFLHAYYIEQDAPVYVIMVHGYRSDGTSIINPIKRFYKQGYNLLIPDLRGHGQSEGDYIGMGWDDRYDILGWIDYILTKDAHAQIILYGVSMGGATVMNVAEKNCHHK